MRFRNWMHLSRPLGLCQCDQKEFAISVETSHLLCAIINFIYARIIGWNHEYDHVYLQSPIYWCLTYFIKTSLCDLYRHAGTRVTRWSHIQFTQKSQNGNREKCTVNVAVLPHLILYLKPHGNFYVTVESVSIYELFKSAHAVLDFVLLVHFVLKPFAGRTFAWASLIEPQNGLSFTSNCCYYEYCLQFCFLFGYAVRTSTISVQIKAVFKIAQSF